MGKGEKFFQISVDDQPRPPSLLQLFHEAAKLLGRSWKPMLSILLILLLPYSFLFFGNYLTVTPLTVDMVNKFLVMGTSKDPSGPANRELLAAIMEDLRGITGVEVASILGSHLLSLLLVMATVYTVAMASKGEQVTLKELLSRMGRTWKGPVATGLYVLLLSFGYMATLFVLIGLLAFISDGAMAAVVLGAAMTVLAILLFVYSQVVWYGGLVVSVVEDCYGLAALGRASELIQGRRRLGFRMNFHLMLMTVIFFTTVYFVKGLLPPCEKMELVGQIVMFYSSLMMNVFMLAVYTVFYNECRRNHGEEVTMKGSLAYTRVPATPTIDGAIP